MNNFLVTSDFSRAELEEIIESAQKFKKGEISDKPLSGKSVAETEDLIESGKATGGMIPKLQSSIELSR